MPAFRQCTLGRDDTAMNFSQESRHDMPVSDLTPRATFLKRHIQSGPVAQLVEQLTFNQWVTGSNPVGLTTEFKGLGLNAWALFIFRTDPEEQPGRTAFNQEAG